MTATIPSTDEIVGRLIDQIGEFAGPDGGVSIWIGPASAEVTILGLNADRWPLHNADDPLAPVRIRDNAAGNGSHTLTVLRVTLLRALQDAAAILAFPPDTTLGARVALKAVDGGASHA